MNEELRELVSKPTASVPAVGKVCFNMSRGASYEAAKRGHIPVIEIGKLKKVPTSWVRKQLGLDFEDV